MPAGFLFHAIIYVTLPVVTFSSTIWLLYLAFLDPDEVHAFLDRSVSFPYIPAPPFGARSQPSVGG